MSVSQVLPQRESSEAFSLFVLFSVVFLGSAGFFITIPSYVGLFLSHSRGMTDNSMSIEERRQLYGLVMSFAPFISMLFTPFLARLSDSISRKFMMSLCLVIAAIGFAMPVLAIAAGSIVLLFAGNMINSLGSASQPIAQAELSKISEGPKRVKLMSLVGVVMTAAMSFGPALGSKLSAEFGVSAPFYACLGLSLINLIMLQYTHVSTKAEVKENPISLLAPLKRSQKGFFSSLGLVFLCQFCWSLYFQSTAFILPEVFNYSIESSYYQGLMSAIGIIMIGSLLLLPTALMTHWPLTTCIRVALVVAGAGMLIMTLCNEYWLHMLVLVPTIIAVAVLYPFYLIQLSEAAARDDQGWAMALASAAIGLAWTLSGYLTAMMINITLYLPLWVASAGLFAAITLTRKGKTNANTL
ncbi:MFS transporter [Veronia nyctiphanis]|uniref:MFS transporter n=1 Tax=Veronia nyctiphanis TaxID=1278244 RepID=A0A4V1LSI1_9GAMM|nr:MFS transporter [Veronia nyctiphanis]RXJ71778.1 MFS transporter [Veronia nyctiphanis]